MKVLVQKKDNLAISLGSTDGKDVVLYIAEKHNVTLPPALAESLLFHINEAAAEEFVCLYDGREPENKLEAFEQAEETAKTQEAAIDELRQEKESLETTASELAESNTQLQIKYDAALLENTRLANELRPLKAKEPPIHDAVPEAS